jgi:hypothetical protein
LIYQKVIRYNKWLFIISKLISYNVVNQANQATQRFWRIKMNVLRAAATVSKMMRNARGADVSQDECALYYRIAQAASAIQVTAFYMTADKPELQDKIDFYQLITRNGRKIFESGGYDMLKSYANDIQAFRDSFSNDYSFTINCRCAISPKLNKVGE